MRKPSKADRLAGLLEDLTVDELDEQLVKLGRAWTRVYTNRQLRAREEGITTPAPPPPKVEGEAQPSPSDGGGAARREQPTEWKTDSRAFDGTFSGLAQCYLTDERSSYRALRHASKKNYESLLKRIRDACGEKLVSDLTAPEIQELHDRWSQGEKFAAAHGLITMLRTLVTFGAVTLKDDSCVRLSFTLHRMKFKAPAARNEQLTEDQAKAIIQMAHQRGRPSIALAQAFQLDCKLRQKDVIGEWVPETEAEESKVIHEGRKWLRGLRWEEIDADLVLRHVTSFEGESVRISLLEDAPNVLKELRKRPELRESSGPVIVNEYTRLPFTAPEFRRQWRMLARACDIPNNVFNMDTRAGRDSGAEDSPARADEKYEELEKERATEDLPSVARH